MFDNARFWRRFAALLCGTLASVALAADDLPITDPTEPPHHLKTTSAKAAYGMLLYSTQVSDSKRSAVVNQRVVAVGSRVAGAVVTAIEPGRVTLRRDSETIVLELIKTPVRRDSKDRL